MPSLKPNSTPVIVEPLECKTNMVDTSSSDLTSGKVTKTILNRLGIFYASGAARVSIPYAQILVACQDHYGVSASETTARRLAMRVQNTLDLMRTLFTSQDDDELLTRVANLTFEHNIVEEVSQSQHIHLEAVPTSVLLPTLFPIRSSTVVTSDMQMSGYKWAETPLRCVTEPVWKECATLFSEHYGVWREKSGRVKLNHVKLKQLITPTKAGIGSRLITARVGDDNTLVGHSFVLLFDIPNDGRVAWITQLVVHTSYRNQGIGKELCRLSWTLDCNIWGLVTSHPYAVRSLERATRRKCIPALITSRAQILIENSPVQYLQKGCETVFNNKTAIVNTKFDVDHAEVTAARNSLTDWSLGDLPDRWEYFAFVFDEQSQSY